MADVQDSLLERAGLMPRAVPPPRVPLPPRASPPAMAGDAAGLFAQAMHAAQQDALAGVEARLSDLVTAAAQRVAEASDKSASVSEEIARLRADIPELVKRAGVIDPDALAAAARAALLAEIALPGSKVSALSSGAADLLPPLRKPDAEYVDTDTGAAIRYALELGSRFILISGPSGSGKTYPAEQELRRSKRRYLKLSGGDGVTRGDLVGRQEASGGATSWRVGIYPHALRHGLAIVHDEIDRTDGLVLAGINSALEREPSMLCPWGETIDAAEGYVVMATCNGLTDETGLYVAQRLSADLPNRAFLVHADYLPAAREIDLIHKSVPGSNGGAEKIVNGLAALRKLYLSGELEAAPSTRVGIRACEIMIGAAPTGTKPARQARTAAQAWDWSYLHGLRPTQREKARMALRGARAL